MLSIRGIYKSNKIIPLEDISVENEVEVIITFLNDIKKPVIKRSSSEVNPTKQFLAKCGGWEDSRTADEIIEDIYSARNSSNTGSQAF